MPRWSAAEPVKATVLPEIAGVPRKPKKFPVPSAIATSAPSLR
jgi:hypothetical protein